MEVLEVVRRRGGVATRADLVEVCGRAPVDRALREGQLLVGARGRYVAASADAAVVLVSQLHGVLCRESAALHHGWAVKQVPDRPHVSVPTKRKVPPALRALVHLHRDDFENGDVVGVATAPSITVAQCLRHLPWDAALAVGDSALRAGLPRRELVALADGLRGPGSRQARRVAGLASPKPKNAFESVLRAIALEVPGLHVEPQVRIRGALQCQPDLVDARLGIVLEADSFEWHGNRKALRRDARRYDLLVSDGWLVLRFAWEDVMFDQDFVSHVISAVVALARERTHCRCCSRRAA